MKVATKATVYFLSTGTRATWGTLNTATGVTEAATAPTDLTECLIRGDMSVIIDDENQELEFKGRDFQFNLNTLRKANIEFAIPMDETNAFYLALRKAKLLKGSIAMALLSDKKDVVGAEGWWADWTVTKFERGEELKNIQMMNVGIAFAYTAVDPEWVAIVEA